VLLVLLVQARAQPQGPAALSTKLQGLSGGGADGMNDKQLAGIIQARDRELKQRAKDIKEEMDEIVTEPYGPAPQPGELCCGPAHLGRSIAWRLPLSAFAFSIEVAGF